MFSSHIVVQNINASETAHALFSKGAIFLLHPVNNLHRVQKKTSTFVFLHNSLKKYSNQFEWKFLTAQK